MTWAELIADLEAYNFECEGGPLQNAIPWLMIKDTFADLLDSKVSDELIEKYEVPRAPRENWKMTKGD
jgi:hypothetical protein